MSNVMKLAFCIVIIIIAAASQTMSIKAKSRRIMYDTQNSLSTEYTGISVTFLSSANELIPSTNYLNSK